MRQPEELTAQNERSLKTLFRAIALSQGQFSLILVRCNYKCLRERVLKQLQEHFSAQINPPLTLTLSESVKLLDSAIQDHLELNSKSLPSTLIILGLDSATFIDDLLSSINQARDKFHIAFPFPLVLWINDQVLQKWVKLAPDIYTWAGTPIQFVPTVDELIHGLEREAESLFAKVLDADTDGFLDNIGVNLRMTTGKRFEIESALQELASHHVSNPVLEASQQFILGRDAYDKGDIKQAYKNYKRSLNIWRQKHDLERQACLLFHLGLVCRRYASINRLKNKRAWEKARRYYQDCMDLLGQENHPNLKAKFINSLAEALQQLGKWKELDKVAKEATCLHRKYHNPISLAEAYGFQSEVYLADCMWEEAKKYADKAIKANGQPLLSAEKYQKSFLAKGKNDEQLKTTSDSEQGGNLDGLKQHNRSWYCLLLAKAQRGLGKLELALEKLEEAKKICNKDYNPQLYIRILEELRSLYFNKKQYLKAFEKKQEKLQIEKQYGFRAFIGAGRLQPQKQVVHSALVPVRSNLDINVLGTSDNQGTIAQEIKASGRNEDVDSLIEKISRPDKRLIVIHGPSGVGKSSLLTAGLVPALHLQTIEGRKPLPVVVQVYTNWTTELGKAFVTSSHKVGTVLDGTLDCLESIVKQLRRNVEQNLLPILIFDQFEEFFINCPEPDKRREFLEFLHRCLDEIDIPHVKVILSLREDYLHCLLECDRLKILEITKNDILNQEIRHSFGNFSKERAKNIIQDLTGSSLERNLIDRLVQDLAKELGEVRPIELQIVGAQLETERITTLEKYCGKNDSSSPKKRLIKKFLDEIIEDCGSENKRIAQLVLYLLTAENSTRPLKTHPELKEGLEKYLTRDFAGKDDELKQVLKILVQSGLVLIFSKPSEIHDDRYQLVHDYLASLVRQEQSTELIVELREEREKRRRVEQKIKLIFSSFSGLFVLGIILILGLELMQAKINKIQFKIESKRQSSLYSLKLNQNFDALRYALDTGKELKSIQRFDFYQNQELGVDDLLQQALSNVREYNRLEHKGKVYNLSFSPEGKMLASSGANGIVKLWKRDGTLLKTLTDHNQDVYKVIFSPDGQMLASGSADKTVKLWKRDGTLVKTLTSHIDEIYDVAFSPDSQMLASGSADKTVKLWKRDGTLVKTLIPHQKLVSKVIFSPDGQTLASASFDGTVNLWKRDGTLVRTLTGHQGGTWDVAFSPDSQTLASAGNDNTVKLWKRDGILLKTLTGHHDWVKSVSFSPDGKMLASGSFDGSVNLWDLDSKLLLKTFKGEGVKTLDRSGPVYRSGSVYSVGFSPDSRMLASSGGDGIVKLWSTKGDDKFPPPIATLTGHQGVVLIVTFFPKDNEMLASAGSDGILRFWKIHEPHVSDSSLDGLLRVSCNWLHDYYLDNLNRTDQKSKDDPEFKEDQAFCLSTKR